MKTFLICDDSYHAEVVDQLCAERLRVEFDTSCSCWSGVYENGVSFGIYWGHPVSDLFGFPPSEDHPDGDPLMVIEDEVLDANGVSNWRLVPSPEPEAGPEILL